MIPTSRAEAAFLGLALGDAFGRTLEFVHLPTVRTQPVDMSAPRWTDDTHMALYLGQACLDHGPGPLDLDHFGMLVGNQFALWLVDPLTPYTAPGSTCLAGVRSWVASHDWRSSGVQKSDGCGAVMRICPLPLLFSGDALTDAAHVSAAITHAHPNAIHASVAASHLLRWVLEDGRLDEGQLWRAIAHLRGPWKGAGVVDRSLEAAIAFARRPTDAWLDEPAIPEGDGGWRSPSALGLALAAALRWGVLSGGGVSQGSFKLAVEKAARIDGDSDSVACLTGMFLGAAGGLEVLPEAWLEHLQDRAKIQSLARALAQAAVHKVTPSPAANPSKVKGESPKSKQEAPAPPEEARTQTLVAVADLHGHREHFRRLLEHLDSALGNEYTLVLLGDYVDNGPDVPGLLDDLIALQSRGVRFVPILGNHDLACLRALGWPGQIPDPAWFDRWCVRYHNPGGGTPAAYGAYTLLEFARKMPAQHRAFLEGLPWFWDNGTYFFVHSGLEAGPIGPQRIRLEARELPADKTQLLPPLREKALATVSDSSWDRVVVSAHTAAPGKRVPGHSHQPHFVTEKRICLSGEVDATQTLYAMVLPERRVLQVRLDTGVREVRN